MAYGKSEYLEKKVLDHVLRVSAFTQPSSLYMALFDGDPEDTGTELTGNGYARQTVTMGAATSGGPSESSNTNTVQFPTVTTAAWEFSVAALMDAQTNGNVLYHGIVNNAPVTIDIGSRYEFPVGTITVREE